MALERGAVAVEPSQQAQDEWVRHIRETAIDISAFQQECPPSYFNNEGQPDLDSEGKQKLRWYLGEGYGPGWPAFQELLRDWRDRGDLAGLEIELS
jgi:cyclohexanone monooxygenase